jgi:hypothetical protein
MSSFIVSAHAVDRYRSRVEALPAASARDAVLDLLSDARIRPTPRHWMRSESRYGGGVRFAYSPRAPRVSFVLRGQTVVTVLTRALYRHAPLVADAPERRYDRKQRRGHRRRCRRPSNPVCMRAALVHVAGVQQGSSG